MSLIRPFRAFRPTKELSSKVAALPYDVMNREEAFEMAKGNPFCFLHITRAEIDLPETVDIHDDAVYLKAKENFNRFIEEGTFIQDETPKIYIYQQQMGNHIQTGVVAAASVDAYQKELIKKHEKTRKDKEDDRVKHVETLLANTGPVFLTYRHRDDIDSLIENITKRETLYSFTTDDGIKHTAWLTTDSETDELNGYFSQIDVMYVADGHHRSASASRVKDMLQANNPNHTGEESYNYFLSVIFPDNQMYIMDYNRVLKDLNGLTKESFFEKVAQKFSIEKTDKCSPDKLHRFGMYIDSVWYKLEPLADVVDENDPVKSLDVSILQDNILSPLLGIEDPRTSKRIDFVGGIRGMKELERLVNSGKYAVAFSMFPTQMDQLMSIADAGEIMPPKSTWFEPKLRSGLFIHSIK
ncbi:DUF1015 domain-containing protein [bacterium]|nr:DUF1015 domain-containing protein [bacterium]